MAVVAGETYAWKGEDSPRMLPVTARQVGVGRNKFYALTNNGDLIIFDMDKADVHKEMGNTKVFCQDPKNYTIAEFGSLSEEMQAAAEEMLRLEFT